MIYELRRYEAAPGKLQALHDLMAKHALPLFRKHGMRVVGVWEPVAGEYTNVLTYMLAYESLDQRERQWADFFADEQWKAALAEARGEEGLPLASRQHYTLFRSTPYSPTP